MTHSDPQIELRQEELREILGIVPPWIVRWGTVLIAMVILTLLIGAAWFRYPDRISSQVVLTASNPIKGELFLSVKDAGKVKIGNRVVLHIDNYPYMQYGMVKGTVEQISLWPEAEYYRVEISLPEGMKSTYKKELVFSKNMTGQAQIITDKMSLLVRILDPVKGLIRRKNNQDV
ncbi:MAG: hypothetical protein A2X22_04520 [Bacteroidetes bacterium GWF2_49_14]|nr:MAG: hypothetical protein A2X22_04520 [Bacteroidetes bacterium GWF2_49_14]HBB92739.1 hypothetical protein [Bacteroidales bacterium]